MLIMIIVVITIIVIIKSPYITRAPCLGMRSSSDDKNSLLVSCGEVGNPRPLVQSCLGYCPHSVTVE